MVDIMKIYKTPENWDIFSNDFLSRKQLEISAAAAKQYFDIDASVSDAEPLEVVEELPGRSSLICQSVAGDYYLLEKREGKPGEFKFINVHKNIDVLRDIVLQEDAFWIDLI